MNCLIRIMYQNILYHSTISYVLCLLNVRQGFAIINKSESTDLTKEGK